MRGWQMGWWVEDRDLGSAVDWEKVLETDT